MDLAWSGRRLHFVGIGGAGMSGLALVARELGAEVTGSDRSGGSAYAARLREAGIEPVMGHDAANVPEGAEVVYSSAIPPENPERAAAASELHRADLLGELTRLRPTIAVSGTHGKTTTSSMLVHALRGAGADPGYLVGRRGALDRLQRGLGDGRVADRRGRRVRPLAAQARAPGRGAHERRARPPRDLLLPARRRGDVPRLPRPGRARGRLGSPGAARARRRRLAALALRRGARAVAGRLALRARRPQGRADGSGRPQRAQRRGRADRLPRDRRPTSRRPPPRCATSRARAGASSTSARRRRARSWSTTTPTTRPRCARRSRRRGRSRRGG